MKNINLGQKDDITYEAIRYRYGWSVVKCKKNKKCTLIRGAKMMGIPFLWMEIPDLIDFGGVPAHVFKSINDVRKNFSVDDD